MKDIRLWGILILALAVRTAMLYSVFADVGRAVTPDSRDYCFLANTLSTEGRYGHRFGPDVFRTPGYPGLLAGTDWVRKTAKIEDMPPNQAYHPFFDCVRPFVGKTVLSFQVLMDLHLVLLTFFLGRSLASHGTGLIAALLQAISPLAAAASCRILTDSIYAFMLTAALMLLIRHFRTGGWWSLLSAALVMGVSCYIRPVGMAFSAIMALVILCSRRGTACSTGILPVLRTTARPRRLLRTASFACIVLLCIAPWVVRNVIVADYWGFSSFATDSMFYYSAAEIEAREQNESVEDIRHLFMLEDFSFWNEYLSSKSVAPSTGALARRRWSRAREIIAEHPWDFVDIHMRGNLAFWLPGAPDALEVLGYTSGDKGTLDVLHREGLWAASKHYFGDNTTAMALAGAMVVIFLVRCVGVVLCGLWRFRPRRMTSAGWLCVLLVVTAFLLPGPANHPRFRVPVEPILSVAAAMGYLGIVEVRRRKKTPDETLGS